MYYHLKGGISVSAEVCICGLVKVSGLAATGAHMFYTETFLGID